MKAQKRMGACTHAALVLAVMGMAAAIAGCGGEKPARTEAAETVRGLHVETVRLQTIPDVLEAPGTVISVATAEIAARTAGTALRVVVREGDRVKQGQLLAQLDEQELLARKNAAQAGLQQAEAGAEGATRGLSMAQAQADVAKKTYDRYVYLRDQKSVSPQEFDEVEAKNRAAQAGLEQAAARLQQAQAGKAQAESEVRAAQEVAGYAGIRAPFDGRVVRRLIEPGTVVMPGMQLFVLEKTGEFQLEATLPAEMLTAEFNGRALRRGTAAEVRLDALPGKVFSGKVAEIEGGADPATHTVQARIDLPRDEAIQSGMFGRASFQRGERQAIVVPESAIVEQGQLRELYAVDSNGIVHLRLVTLGQQIGKLREVLSGLGVGEKIVSDPGARELDGKKVETSL
jgi:multidrug efflux pump subunit AcrA (membrane-fusion protein)